MPEPFPPLQAREYLGCAPAFLCKSFPERSQDCEEQPVDLTSISRFELLR